MSVVRAGEAGSDVYIYVCEVAPGGVECMRLRCCDLLDSPTAMIAHVQEHRAAGDTVPEWVEDAIWIEWWFVGAGLMMPADMFSIIAPTFESIRRMIRGLPK